MQRLPRRDARELLQIRHPGAELVHQPGVIPIQLSQLTLENFNAKP
jgi:hypothetical protein